MFVLTFFSLDKLNIQNITKYDTASRWAPFVEFYKYTKRPNESLFNIFFLCHMSCHKQNQKELC